MPYNQGVNSSWERSIRFPTRRSLVLFVSTCVALTACGINLPLAPTTQGPSQTPPSPSATAAQTPLETPANLPSGLEDASFGVIYAETPGGVLRVKPGRRSVRFITTPQVNAFRDFVATPSGLIVKPVDGAGGFSLGPDLSTTTLPDGLPNPSRLYAGSNETLWVVPEDADEDGRWTVSIYSAQLGALTLVKHWPIASAKDAPRPDGTGKLVAPTARGQYLEISASSTRRLTGWMPGASLVAIGNSTILLRRCAACHVIERKRSESDHTRRATSRGLTALDKLLANPNLLGIDQISPNGRYLSASLLTGGNRDRQRVAVLDLRSGKLFVIPGEVVRVNANDQSVWLGRRWFVAITDESLRFVDLEQLTAQTWRGPKITRIAATK
jgi:hypothetical protein